MRVLLADDERKVLSAMRFLLEQDRSIKVIGEVLDLAELIAKLQSRCPDLLLIDWELPGLSSSRFQEEIRNRCPRLMVVALSGRAEARRSALEAGVDAFVSKSEPPEHLLHALATCACKGSGLTS